MKAKKGMIKHLTGNLRKFFLNSSKTIDELKVEIEVQKTFLWGETEWFCLKHVISTDNREMSHLCFNHKYITCRSFYNLWVNFNVFSNKS